MSKFGFDKILEEWTLMKEELLSELAEAAKKQFIEDFENKSFNGKQWAERKPRKDDDGHPLLEQTGELKSALEGAEVIINSDGFSIEIENDYADYLNNGTSEMVARPFMGESSELDKRLEETINEQLDKIFNI